MLLWAVSLIRYDTTAATKNVDLNERNPRQIASIVRRERQNRYLGDLIADGNDRWNT